MQITDYLALSSSQIALGSRRPSEEAGAPCATYLSDFTTQLLRQLADLGVFPLQLQMRELVLKTNSPHLAGRAFRVWMRRSELSTKALIGLQADLHAYHPSESRHKVRQLVLRHSEGMQKTLEMIDEATSFEECLGAWALGALVPAVVSNRAEVPHLDRGLTLPGYRMPGEAAIEPWSYFEVPAPRRSLGYTLREATAIAETLSGHGHNAIRYIWSTFSTWALPGGRPLQEIHEGWETSIRKLHAVEYIAGSIAATLAQYTPVVLHFCEDAQTPAIGRAIEAELARRKSEREREDAARFCYATATPLEKRHHRLSSWLQSQIVPGSRDFATASDADLLAAHRDIKSMEGTAVLYGVSAKRMRDRLQACEGADA